MKRVEIATKPPEAPKPAKKVRLSLKLSPDAVQLGRGMASREERTFSGLLETLIQRAARSPKPDEIADAAAAETNPQALLLKDIRFARPLMSIDAARWILDLSEDKVIELIEGESALPAFDIAVPRSARREFRVLSRGVAEYKSRPGGAEFGQYLETEELLPFILPPHDHEFFRGTEIQRALNCSSTHVIRLVESGALAQIPGSRHASGRNGTPAVSRASFIGFLTKRRVG